MAVNIFFYFPERDEDFIRLTDDEQVYRDILSSCARFRNGTRVSNQVTVFYDSDNVARFASQAASIVNGTYIHSVRTQLQQIFGRSAKDTHSDRKADGSCSYFQWASGEIHPAHSILKEAAEFSDSNVAIISLGEGVLLDRSNAFVLKDALHLPDTPKIYRVPVFADHRLFANWVHRQTTSSTFDLQNEDQFVDTGRWRFNQKIYRQISTGRLFYFDFFHRENKIHYEVFDASGTNHLGEADESGNLRPNSADDDKSISNIMR